MPLLRQHVRPGTAPDAKRIEQLVADLGSEKFSIREKSQQELEGLGRSAASALNAALKNDPSPEVRRRAQHLLDRIGAEVLSGDQLRILRAVEVLELTRTPDAIAVLKNLAAGAPEIPPTLQAQDTLARLKAK